MSKKAEKPKARKAPAPSTARKNGAKAAPSEPKREISKICCLVTYWRFLEAEQAYQAAIAGTDEESDELICEHADEQYGIEMKLSKLIPQDFTEVCEPLRFAIDMREGGFRTDGADQMMLRNILESLPSVRSNDGQAARLEGAQKMHGHLAGILDDVSRNMDTSNGPHDESAFAVAP